MVPAALEVPGDHDVIDAVGDVPGYPTVIVLPLGQVPPPGDPSLEDPPPGEPKSMELPPAESQSEELKSMGFRLRDTAFPDKS
jgi:hypothetical protein